MGVLLGVSCAPSGDSQVTERPVTSTRPATTGADTVAIIEELSFDPLGLPQDHLLAPVVYRDSISLANIGGSSIGLDEPFTDSTGVGLTRDSSAAYDTYRIQLFNSLTFSEATQERNVAQEIFDYQTTLDYEVPYFKVRIGDFDDFKTAEKYLRDFVNPAGYPNSWVARVRVLPVRDISFEMALELFFDSLRAEIEAEESLTDSLSGVDSMTVDTVSDDESSEDADNDSEKGAGGE